MVTNIDMQAPKTMPLQNRRLQLRTQVRDPRTASPVSHCALCVIHLRTRDACALGPEAVPQRADNCVTGRNTATDADALAAVPFRPTTDAVQANDMHY